MAALIIFPKYRLNNNYEFSMEHFEKFDLISLSHTSFRHDRKLGNENNMNRKGLIQIKQPWIIYPNATQTLFINILTLIITLHDENIS